VTWLPEWQSRQIRLCTLQRSHTRLPISGHLIWEHASVHKACSPRRCTAQRTVVTYHATYAPPEFGCQGPVTSAPALCCVSHTLRYGAVREAAGRAGYPSDRYRPRNAARNPRLRVPRVPRPGPHGLPHGADLQTGTFGIPAASDEQLLPRSSPTLPQTVPSPTSTQTSRRLVRFTNPQRIEKGASAPTSRFENEKVTTADRAH
jgi:hypothetical protein